MVPPFLGGTELGGFAEHCRDKGTKKTVTTRRASKFGGGRQSRGQKPED